MTTTNGFIGNRLSRNKTLPDRIADKLRDAIINGQLKGGQQLKQDEIAKSFNASMIPVREALRILEAQGLVKFYANKGAVVNKFSVEEIEEIFDIRIMLEKGALELSINQLTEEELNYAEHLLKKMDALDEEEYLSDLNLKFHNVLYGAGKKEMLLELIREMHTKVERYMRIYLINLSSHPVSQEEHYMLLEACRNKDLDSAVEILTEHMSRAKRFLIEFLKSKNE